MSQQDDLPRRLAVEVLELEVLIAEMEREQRSLAEHVTELHALLKHLRTIQSQLSPPRTLHN
jgi:prefoldin subunit 5